MPYICKRDGTPVSEPPQLSEEQRRAMAKVIAENMVRKYRHLIVDAVAQAEANQFK